MVTFHFPNLTSRTKRRSALWSLLLIAAGITAGVAGCAPGAPKTIKVKGMVTYAGVKLNRGTIAFTPKNTAPDSPSRPATAELDSEGNYTMSTTNPGDGVFPGQYAVTVVSYEQPPDPATPGQEVWAIPRKYGDPQRSGLQAEIHEGDSEPVELDFDLVGEKNK